MDCSGSENKDKNRKFYRKNVEKIYTKSLAFLKVNEYN